MPVEFAQSGAADFSGNVPTGVASSGSCGPSKTEAAIKCDADSHSQLVLIFKNIIAPTEARLNFFLIAEYQNLHRKKSITYEKCWPLVRPQASILCISKYHLSTWMRHLYIYRDVVLCRAN